MEYEVKLTFYLSVALFIRRKQFDTFHCSNIRKHIFGKWTFVQYGAEERYFLLYLRFP